MMKRIILGILTLASVCTINAQENLYLFKHNGEVISYKMSDVDSITTKDNITVYKQKKITTTFATEDVDSISFYRPIADATKDNVKTLIIKKEYFGMIEGDFYYIDVEAKNFDNTDAEVTWTSSDATIAEVDEYGYVDAKRPGCVELTAHAGSLTATAYVTIVVDPENAYHHGYNELTDRYKTIYRYILSTALKFDANAEEYSDVLNNRLYLNWNDCGTYPESSTDISRITNIVMKDYPEMWMIANYLWRYDYNKYQYYIRITKSTTPQFYYEHMKVCYDACDYILQTVTSDMPEWQKVLIAHDEFIHYSSYGGMSKANAGNIDGALHDKKAVCEGRSRAYVMLCQRMGMKSIYVCGAQNCGEDATTNEIVWGNHAWNYVEVDGNWYVLDTTADGAIIGTCGHSKFLVGKEVTDTDYSLTDSNGYDDNVSTTSYGALPTLADKNYSYPGRP